MKVEEQYIKQLLEEKQSLENEIEQEHARYGELLQRKRELEKFLFQKIGLERLEKHPNYYQAKHMLLKKEDVDELLKNLFPKGAN